MIWMNAQLVSTTVSMIVTTHREVTSAFAPKDTRRSTINALVCYEWFLIFMSISTREEFLFFYFKDVNECLEQPGSCIAPAQCINTLGSFKCMCPRGYQLDETGTQCLDTDECIDDGRCQTGCQVNKSYLHNSMLRA